MRLLALLIFILLIKAAVVVRAITVAGIGLGPDEAQYWTWSQHLDWGYYSKPPGIAWEIWIGTHFLGNTEWGVRAGALVIGTLLPLAVYLLAFASGLGYATAFWAGTVMALSPLGILASFLATTDAGYILFWTLGCAVLARALHLDKPPCYPLFGLLIFCGALFKWPIYLLWVLLGAFLVIFRRSYPIDYRKLGFGFLISCLALMPSIIWNRTHDWATFRHVMGNITGETISISARAQPLFHGNALEFIGAQAGLLSPVLFVLFLIAIGVMFRHFSKVPRAVVFCGMVSLSLLLPYIFMAFFKKMQGNWCAFVYPTGIVLLCWCLVEHIPRGRVWIKLGVGVSVILFSLVMAIPFIQSHNLWGKYPIPYKYNLFQHNVGWDELNRVLKDAGYDPKHHFLFGDKYQMSSILSFYSEGQKRAYFFNLNHIRRNQFSYWPQMSQEQKGKTGFFVWVENVSKLEKNGWQQIDAYQSLLAPYFAHVRLVEVRPLFYSYDKTAKVAAIFICEGYRGVEPSEVDVY